MTIALRRPRMTREEFLSWAQVQDVRYEFDGFEPVSMTGGTVDHNQISQNIQFALRARLRGSACRALGPDAGVATVGDTVRYPDALVTCTKVPGTAHLVPGVVVVFEVLSPSSGRIDRIEKVREYRAVASIRRYVILESTSVGLTVFERLGAGDNWTASTLTEDDVLQMEEIGVEVPVSELYQDVELPGTDGKNSATRDDDAART